MIWKEAMEKMGLMVKCRKDKGHDLWLRPWTSCRVQVSGHALIIPAFFFRKKGYINFVSKSVRRPSVRASVRPSRFL